MAIPFVTEPSVAYGVATNSSPLIRRVMANNPGKFSYHGTGTYLIGHGDGVAIVDPGPRDDQHVAAVLQAVAGERVTHLLITHTHGDHSPAAAAVAEATGARTYAYGPHPAHARGEDDPDDDGFLDDPLLQTSNPTEAAPSEAKSAEEVAAEIEKFRPDTEFVPDVTVAHGDVLAGTDWSVECLHTPGHISNHLCFALREEQALFSGDHVMGWSTTIVPPPDGSMADYFTSLELLLGRPETVYYPTHGPAITDPQPFVQALLEHRRDRERQILAVLDSGSATIGEMVVTMYADVDQALHKPAARSVRSHLDHLEARGLVERDGQRPPRFSALG